MITSKQIRKRLLALKRKDRELVFDFIEYLNRLCLSPNTNELYIDADIAKDEIWKFINQNNFSQHVIETLQISFKYYQNLDIGYNKPLQNVQIGT